MNVRIVDSICSKKLINAVEKLYGGRYVCTSQLKTVDGWTTNPVYVFYQANPKKELGHSHYYGIFTEYGRTKIYDAGLMTGEKVCGLITPQRRFLYSAYSHDFVQEGPNFVDGGREYFRYSVGPGAIMACIEFEETGPILKDESGNFHDVKQWAA